MRKKQEINAKVSADTVKWFEFFASESNKSIGEVIDQFVISSQATNIDEIAFAAIQSLNTTIVQSKENQTAVYMRLMAYLALSLVMGKEESIRPLMTDIMDECFIVVDRFKKIPKNA